jgi:adenylate kinase family enzyme
MKRVVVLGPGGAGKTSFAHDLGRKTGLPVIELDKHFWKADLSPTPTNEWIEAQKAIAGADYWIMDGDLGPYDALSARLCRADTVIVLDFPLLLRILRVIRRGKEQMEFWRWMLTWRWVSRPRLMRDIASCAATAEVHVLRSSTAARAFLEQARRAT